MSSLEDMVDDEVNNASKKELKKDETRIISLGDSSVASLEGITDSVTLLGRMASIQKEIVSKGTVDRMVANDLTVLEKDFFNGRISLEEFTVHHSKTNYALVKSTLEKRMCKEVEAVKERYKTIKENITAIEKTIEILLYTAEQLVSIRSTNSRALTSAVRLNPLMYVSGVHGSKNFLNVKLTDQLEGNASGLSEITSATFDISTVLYSNPELGSFIYAATSDNEYTSIELIDIMSSKDCVDIYGKVSIRDVLNLFIKYGPKSRMLRLHRFSTSLIKELKDTVEEQERMYACYPDGIEWNIHSITEHQKKLQKLATIDHLSNSFSKIMPSCEKLITGINLMLGNYE